jgi:hypothetical protein
MKQEMTASVSEGSSDETILIQSKSPFTYLDHLRLWL